MPPLRVCFRWLAFLVPSGILSAWLFLWLQWLFPLEDGIEPALMIVPTVLLVGLCLGIGWGAVSTKRSRAGLVMLVLVMAASAIKFWVGFVLANGPREPDVAVVVNGVLISLGAGAFFFSRLLTSRTSKQWSRPFAVSLLPLIVVVSAFGCADNFHKWCWPWTSLQPSLMAFLTDAEATATRLGVPRDRGLNPEERELWTQIVDRELTLRFPIINKPVTARVIDLTGRVWLHWGGDMFGYLDPVTMRIHGARN